MERSIVIAVGGLPGTGKSEVARRISQRMGALLLRSDEIRKELFPQPYYHAEEMQRTYAELFCRVAAVLAQGRPVVLDATFWCRAFRRRVVEVAEAASVPWYFVLVTAPEELVRQRIGQRRRDVSDADFEVYLQMRDQFEPWKEIERNRRSRIENGKDLSHLDREIGVLIRTWMGG